MNKFKTFILLIVSFILQTTIFSKLDIFGANVNIIIPAVIALSQVLGARVGAYSGLIIGLLEDFLFTKLVGVRALSHFLIGSFVASDRFNFSKDKRTGVILTLIASIFNFILVSGLYYIVFRNSGFIDYLPIPILVESLINALVYFIYISLVKKIMYIPTYRI